MFILTLIEILCMWLASGLLAYYIGKKLIGEFNIYGIIACLLSGPVILFIFMAVLVNRWASMIAKPPSMVEKVRQNNPRKEPL